jgi:hypothetical protein
VDPLKVKKETVIGKLFGRLLGNQKKIIGNSPLVEI